MPVSLVATLKELRQLPRRNPFRVCVFCEWDASFPGLPKRNPGLKLANAFSVKFKLQRYQRLRKLGE